MAESNNRLPLFAALASAAAFACAFLCAMASWMWARAEHQLTDAQIQLERAQRQRPAPLAAASKADENAPGDVESLKREVQKLSGDLKRLKAVYVKAARRSYGPEMATGEPDVLQAGDSPNAWCPLTEDGNEWLTLEYDDAVKIAAVKVCENYNPGALVKVSVIDAEGNETVAWSGADPTRPGSGMGVSIVPLNSMPTASRIKIYIDSHAVQGWHEIDAVGIVDAAGKTHWATACEASSSYADPHAAAVPAQPQPQEVPREF